MSKDAFLRCSVRATTNEGRVRGLCSAFPDLFSPEALKPTTTAAVSTAAVMSRLTRVQEGRLGLADVLANRARHQPFARLDAEDAELPNWFFVDGSGAFRGPLTAVQMDELFQSGELGEKTMIKNKFEENSQELLKLVTRYYKKFGVSEEEALDKNSLISRKLADFRKGEVVCRRTVNLEKFRPLAKPTGQKSGAWATSVYTLSVASTRDADEHEAPCFDSPPVLSAPRSRAQTIAY